MVNLRKIKLALVLGMVLSLTGCCCHAPHKKRALFQVSSMWLLKQGDYHGRISLKELKTKGNFGIGTFDGLDGEMVEIDGVIYQTKADGRVYLPEDDLKTPFAAVVFFRSNQSFAVEKCASLAELAEFIEARIADKDMIYAVRVEGEFNYLKFRAPQRQNKPYVPLEEALKSQSIFEHSNIQGVLVGFWFPAYLAEFNFSGIHLHFLSADKHSGGHLLECKFVKLRVDLECVDEFKARLSAAIK